MADDFKPGLEGVVAVETEIAEPDKEGGVLRYRGVDITELVGHVPVRARLGAAGRQRPQLGHAGAGAVRAVGLTGNAPADLQARRRGSRGLWKLGKLNEISDEQAREDLGRLSSQMMGIVARSARLADGHNGSGARGRRRAGQDGSREVPAAAGAARPTRSAVKAIDTYWICTAEHGLNASTFTARVVASTGADCGAALSAAVGALSGPLHGGAPAYVKPMLEEVAAMGDPERWVKDTLDSGKRIMGFGHRIYRAEDPRSRILKETARELGSPQIEIAEQLEEAALAELERRHPERPLKTNVEYYSAARARHRRGPAAARARDVRLLARRRLVGAHPRAEAHRQASSGRTRATSGRRRARSQLA